MGLIEREASNNTYLRINSNGNLYISSKDPKDGFVEHIAQQTGAVSYWKEYYNGLTGYLDNVTLNTTQNKEGIPMQVFTLVFKDYETGDRFYVSFNYLTNKGTLHRYVKSFVKFCKNIDYSRELAFNAFKRKQGDQYAPSELSFAYVLEDGSNELIPFYYKKGQNGWVEKEKVYDPVRKIEVSDSRKQDAFAAERLDEFLTEFNAKISEVRRTIAKRYANKAVGTEPQVNQQVAQQPTAQQMPPQYQAQPVPDYPVGQPVPSAIPPQQTQAAPPSPRQYAQQAPQSVNGNGIPPQFAPDEEDDLPF